MSNLSREELLNDGYSRCERCLAHCPHDKLRTVWPLGSCYECWLGYDGTRKYITEAA